MLEEIDYGEWWNPATPSEAASGVVLRESRRRAARIEMVGAASSIWAPHATGSGSQRVISSLDAEHVPILHGRLARCGPATALDCRFDGLSIGVTQTNRLRVDRLVLGVHLETADAAIFRRIEVRVPAVAALLGSPFPSHPAFMRPVGRKTFRLPFDLRRSSWKDGSLRTTFEYQIAGAVHQAGADVSFVPRVVVSSAKPRSLRGLLDDWLFPLADLVMISTGQPFRPTTIGLWTRSTASPHGWSAGRADLWMAGMDEHAAANEGESSRTIRPLVTLEQLSTAEPPRQLTEIVRNARALRTDHEVFFGLLVESINEPDKPVQNRYLDLTSALEAFHARAIGDRIVIEDFKKQRAAILDWVKSAKRAGTFAPADAAFITRWLAPHPFTSLPASISALRKRASPTRRWSVTPDTIARLRNDIAHGNSPEGMSDLPEAAAELLELARLLALRELGVAR